MMSRIFSALLLALAGSGLWGIAVGTARFSSHRMGAKLETVLRASLSHSGVGNRDILYSLHELQKNAQGDWVVNRLGLKNMDESQRKELIGDLKDAGATVEELTKDGERMIQVKRGGHLFQEIRFLKS